MRFLYNWIREFAPIELSPKDLAEVLTRAGLEVEEVRPLPRGSDGIVVARIEEVSPHPRADRLVLCKVTTGGESCSIVCGARNMKAGDRVPLASPGSSLPSGRCIERARIRGETSDGMLCSEAELGISTDQEGIMILPPEAPLGEPVYRYIGWDDTLLDVAVNANRGDYLGMMGLAREISALTGVPLTLPGIQRDSGDTLLDAPTVFIEEPELCTRYAAVRISGVRIGPSPLRTRARLLALGLRSINNLVDMTNYVMLETGQPLHAFDWSKVLAGKIVVRTARSSTTFVTLDRVERQISSTDLVIADGERPIALAGIMGGLNTEVTAETSEILLESANFQPTSIRRTSRRLGLRTEASYRFERGVDPEWVPYALSRAQELMAVFWSGLRTSPLSIVGAPPGRRKRVFLSDTRARTLLGVPVERGSAKEILVRLGGEAIETTHGLEVEPPSYRPDWNDDADLIEEIARVRGYDSFPSSMPVTSLQSGMVSPARHWEKRARQTLIQRDFAEIVALAFASPQSNRFFPFLNGPHAKPLSLLNPLSSEDSEMRLSLLGGLLKVLGHNVQHGEKCVRIFQLGKVYADFAGRVNEEKRLSGLLFGQDEGRGLTTEGKAPDFLMMKGVVEDLLEEMGIVAYWPRMAEPGFLHVGKAAAILCRGEKIGVAGELHPDWVRRMDLMDGIYLFELDFGLMGKYASAGSSFRPLPRFPAIVRDFAIVIQEDRPSSEILSFLEGRQDSLIQGARIFDHYTGAPIPPGHKGLGFRITYRSADRTLTEDEVEAIHQKLLGEVLKSFGGQMRV